MKLSGTGFEHHSDECEISVQEQRFSGGVQGPAKPAAKGFAADKPASGSRPFECDLFDLLSNAPYEIVRHRFRASFGRMRDFGARTAIFRRGARPRKARRKGICRGQTGQWVTPFRVLHSPFTLMEFRAFSFPVAEVILSDMASLSSDLSDKNNVHSNPILFFPTEAKKRHFGLMERTWEEPLHQTPQSFLRLLRQESSVIPWKL